VGIYNSSYTRVRPFFRILLDRDRGGSSWLTKLLALGQNEQALSSDLSADPGLLHPTYLDNERKLSPPKEFLRWLILNPEKMTWPKNGTAQYGTDTQQWREKLMGRRDLSREPSDRHDELRDTDRETAIAEGLKGLDRFGPAGSRMKWWAFEGSTAVDCYLATDKLKIYVEGKFTDVLSPSTDWYRTRNQLMRNLESAQADAKGTPFVCLLITEDGPFGILEAKKIQSSLPHLADAQQQDLMRHFLGATTWRQACQATGVDYSSLPSTV
jgi:hypothetical protein